MTLRIIAGEHRGRTLRTARGNITRPLRAPVREALFNIIGDWVADKLVWDLFAGTGGTGIEALSRGARHVYFVEKNNQALDALRDNLDSLGLGERSSVLKADAWNLMAEDLDDEEPDLIFLDPPYKTVAEDAVLAVCRVMGYVEQLAPGGLLCFHFEEGLLDEDDFDEEYGVDLRRWGRTAMALIEAPE